MMFITVESVECFIVINDMPFIIKGYKMLFNEMSHNIDFSGLSVRVFVLLAGIGCPAFKVVK